MEKEPQVSVNAVSNSARDGPASPDRALPAPDETDLCVDPHERRQSPEQRQRIKHPKHEAVEDEPEIILPVHVDNDSCPYIGSKPISG